MEREKQMKVRELAEKSGFQVHADEIAFDKEIEGVFCGDLLSWVMGNCHESNAWITVQTHLNVVAVAALKEISCLIIVQDASIPQETLDKAKEEHIAVFETSMSAYEACVFCHEIGC